MVFTKVLLQSVVVDIVLLLAMGGATVTDMASLVFVSTVGVELIIAIESLPTESTLGVALEATLVDSTRFMIAKFLVFPQIGHGEESVLMREYLFVPRTKVTIMSYKAQVSRLVVKWHFMRIWKTGSKLTTSPFHACSSHDDASPAIQDRRHHNLHQGSCIAATTPCLQRFHPSHNESPGSRRSEQSLSSQSPRTGAPDRQ
jgi:hypothetical protein